MSLTVVNDQNLFSGWGALQTHPSPTELRMRNPWTCARKSFDRQPGIGSGVGFSSPLSLTKFRACVAHPRPNAEADYPRSSLLGRAQPGENRAQPSHPAISAIKITSREPAASNGPPSQSPSTSRSTSPERAIRASTCCRDGNRSVLFVVVSRAEGSRKSGKRSTRHPCQGCPKFR
jgi:hypothetical protein